MNRIKDLRKERNITQKYLAEQLGVAQNTLSTWEVGRYDPDNNNLVRIANFFNVSVDYLLCRTEKKEPATDDGDKLDPNTVVLYRDGKKRVIQYTEEQMAKLDFMLASLKENSPSEYDQVVDRINRLSASNRSKLLELIDLFLAAQDNEK